MRQDDEPVVDVSTRPDLPTSPPDEHDSPSRRTTFTGGIWSAAATVLPMGSTLALSVVISRVLGAEVLGEQSLVAYVGSLMFSVLIYSFTQSSLQLLASARGARDHARLAWLTRWSFGAHLVSGVTAAVIMVSAGLMRSDYQVLWFIGAVTAVVDSVGWAYASRDIARRGWAPTASRRLLAQAASPLLAIGAVYAGLGVEGVFGAQLLVAVVLLVFLRRIDPQVKRLPVDGLDAPPWRPVLRLAGLFALSALIIQVVERRLELVFLDAFHDSTSVAMYSVAFNVVGIPLMLSASLIGAAMPAIASRHAADPGSVVGALGRAARIVVAVNLVLVSGTITVGPGLVSGVYGPEFAEAAHIVRVLGLTLLIAPLGHLCTALWTGTGRLRPVLVAGGTAAAVDVVLALLLIPPFAEVGAVIATMSAQAVSAGLIVGYTLRQGVRPQVKPRRLGAALLVASLAGGAATACVLLVPGWGGEAVGLVAFGVVLALGCRFIGLFDPEDTEWLASTVPGPAEKVLRAVTPRRGAYAKSVA